MNSNLIISNKEEKEFEKLYSEGLKVLGKEFLNQHKFYVSKKFEHIKEYKGIECVFLKSIPDNEIILGKINVN